MRAWRPSTSAMTRRQTLVELVDTRSQAFLQPVLAATFVAESVHPILDWGVISGAIARHWPASTASSSLTTDSTKQAPAGLWQSLLQLFLPSPGELTTLPQVPYSWTKNVGHSEGWERTEKEKREERRERGGKKGGWSIGKRSREKRGREKGRIEGKAGNGRSPKEGDFNSISIPIPYLTGVAIFIAEGDWASTCSWAAVRMLCQHWADIFVLWRRRSIHSLQSRPVCSQCGLDWSMM